MPHLVSCKRAVYSVSRVYAMSAALFGKQKEKLSSQGTEPSY